MSIEQGHRQIFHYFTNIPYFHTQNKYGPGWELVPRAVAQQPLPCGGPKLTVTFERTKTENYCIPWANNPHDVGCHNFKTRTLLVKILYFLSYGYLLASHVVKILNENLNSL